MMNRLFAIFVLLLLLSQGTFIMCEEAEVSNNLQGIADPNTNENDVLALMEQVRTTRPIDDQAKLWAQIANSSTYANARRRRAILLLFDRHVRCGMELRLVASLLANPTWLTRDSIAAVRELGGKIPVLILPGETVFVVMPSLPLDDVSAVYLRVQDSPSEESFYNALSGKESAAAMLKITAVRVSSSSADDQRLLNHTCAEASIPDCSP